MVCSCCCFWYLKKSCWVFLRFLDRWFGICLSLIWKVVGHCQFKYFFFLLFLLLILQFLVCYTFWSCPTVLGPSVLFNSVFSLHLSLRSFHWPMFSSLLLLFLTVSSLLISLSRPSIISFTVFVIYRISFLFFLKVSTSSLNITHLNLRIVYSFH